MSKALQLGKWVPRQQSQALPPHQCHFSLSVLLLSGQLPARNRDCIYTTKACHRHICSFLSEPKRSPLGCETRELGREWRHFNLVGKSCRPWEWVSAKSRLECIMLPAWAARVSISNNQSLHSKMVQSDCNIRGATI